MVPSLWMRRSFPFLKITVAPLAVAAVTERMYCVKDGIYSACFSITFRCLPLLSIRQTSASPRRSATPTHCVPFTGSTQCVLAWNLSSNLLNFARSVTMCSCPAIDHQASHVDSSCPLTHSEGILHVLVICHPGDLTCVVSIPVLFPSTGRVPVCGALAVTAP